jgi:hypothetical protein
MTAGKQMDNNSSAREEAHIQLLHVTSNDEQKLHYLINKLWFFYSLKHISNQDQEAELLGKLSTEKPENLFDIIIADLRPSSPFKQENRDLLFSRLKEHQRPLISISSDDNYTCDDHNPNWLHITLPTHQINKYAPEIKDSIANFWFCLPKK